MKLRFVFDKETPGTVRFKEVDENGSTVPQASTVVGMIYVKKAAAMTLGNPKAITVEINAA